MLLSRGRVQSQPSDSAPVSRIDVNDRVGEQGKSQNRAAVRSVAVTGSSGLLGSQVSSILTAEKGVALRKIDVRDDGSGATVIADLADEGQTADIFTGVESIIHCAGLPRPGELTGWDLLHKNVKIGFNVVNTAVSANVSRIVNASSISVYGFPFYTSLPTPSQFPLTEVEPRTPQDPYGLSKLFVEDVMDAHAYANQLLVTHLRFPWIQNSITFFADRSRSEESGFDAANLWSYIDVRDAAAALVAAIDVPYFEHASTRAFNVAASDNMNGRITNDLIRTLFPMASTSVLDDQSLISSLSFEAACGFSPHHSWKEYDRDRTN